MPPVRLCDLCPAGILRCGLDSKNSGLDRSSIAMGWLFIKSSISRVSSSSGVNNERVSLSEGGFNRPSAALKDGNAAIANPVVVARKAIAVNPRARLQNGFLTGGVGVKAAATIINNWLRRYDFTNLQQFLTRY